MRQLVFLFAYEFVCVKDARKKRAFKARRNVPRDTLRAFGGVWRFAFISIFTVQVVEKSVRRFFACIVLFFLKRKGEIKFNLVTADLASAFLCCLVCNNIQKFTRKMSKMKKILEKAKKF